MGHHSAIKQYMMQIHDVSAWTSLRHFAWGKKPDTKGHMLDDSMHMKYPAQTSLETDRKHISGMIDHERKGIA